MKSADIFARLDELIEGQQWLAAHFDELREAVAALAALSNVAADHGTGRLVPALASVFGSRPFTSGRAIQAAETSADLRRALDDLGVDSARSLGWRLAGLEGRNAGGWTVSRSGESGAGVRWLVSRVSS